MLGSVIDLFEGGSSCSVGSVNTRDSVFFNSKNCSYHCLLHPAVSVSKVIGGCGPIGELPPQK